MALRRWAEGLTAVWGRFVRAARSDRPCEAFRVLRCDTSAPNAGGPRHADVTVIYTLGGAMRLVDLGLLALHVAGIGLVAFSLLLYVFMAMALMDFGPTASLVAPAVTLAPIVLLVMVAMRSGFGAAAIPVILVGAVILVVRLLGGMFDMTQVLNVAFWSLAPMVGPLVGLGMIAFAASASRTRARDRGERADTGSSGGR
jgi:hypothetical protein